MESFLRAFARVFRDTGHAMDDKALTYASYLRIDDLLALQERRSSPPEHDEMLFIVIHQVYELWFKQTLHELATLRGSFERDDVPHVLNTLKRVLTILKTLVSQVDVLETMTPVSFASFRARLESASGFQSRQFRLVEFALGKRDARITAQADAQNPLLAASREPSIYDAFLGWLARRGFAIPASVLTRDFSQPLPESAEVRKALVDIYRHHAVETQVAERLVDFDEGLQEWRYRHVKMVERTIGFKAGTGGSAGAEYLRSTLFKPLFADLWAIRTEL
jgi:tryptophan 2,3-dioxygenase